MTELNLSAFPMLCHTPCLTIRAEENFMRLFLGKIDKIFHVVPPLSTIFFRAVVFFETIHISFGTQGCGWVVVVKFET